LSQYCRLPRQYRSTRALYSSSSTRFSYQDKRAKPGNFNSTTAIPNKSLHFRQTAPRFFKLRNDFKLRYKKTIIKPTLQKTLKCGIIQCKLCSLHGIPYNEPGNLTKSNARTQQWTERCLHRWLHFSMAHRPVFPLNTSFAIRFLFKRWPSFELSHRPV
jgi:hypothetical protein